MSTTSDARPVADDLFVRDDDGAALIGTRCRGCGSHYFPISLSCRNPACETKDVERVPFGRTGRLYSWTVQHYQPPALYRVDDWAPYAVGLVEVPEGLRVLARIDTTDLAGLRVDQPLRLALVPLYVDDDGTRVETYAYAPTTDGGAS